MLQATHIEVTLIEMKTETEITTKVEIETTTRVETGSLKETLIGKGREKEDLENTGETHQEEVTRRGGLIHQGEGHLLGDTEKTHPHPEDTTKEDPTGQKDRLHLAKKGTKGLKTTPTETTTTKRDPDIPISILKKSHFLKSGRITNHLSQGTRKPTLKRRRRCKRGQMEKNLRTPGACSESIYLS
jgi:hypothetical protein